MMYAYVVVNAKREAISTFPILRANSSQETIERAARETLDRAKHCAVDWSRIRDREYFVVEATREAFYASDYSKGVFV